MTSSHNTPNIKPGACTSGPDNRQIVWKPSNLPELPAFGDMCVM